MKRLLLSTILAIVIFSLLPKSVYARSGCCSHHGGVCGCGCCDGTGLSSTCAPYYPGCSGGNSRETPIYVPEVIPTRVPPTSIPTRIPTQRPLPTRIPTATTIPTSTISPTPKPNITDMETPEPSSAPTVNTPHRSFFTWFFSMLSKFLNQ